MFRWIVLVIIAGIIGLIGSAAYYLLPNVSIVTIPAKGRAYVIVKDAKLDPLSPSQAPILYILVENTGTVEARGYLKDLTCSFKDVEPRFLTYMPTLADSNSLPAKQLPSGIRSTLNCWTIGGSNC